MPCDGCGDVLAAATAAAYAPLCRACAGRDAPRQSLPSQTTQAEYGLDN
jgi:hypothetical protein